MKPPMALPTEATTGAMMDTSDLDPVPPDAAAAAPGADGGDRGGGGDAGGGGGGEFVRLAPPAFGVQRILPCNARHAAARARANACAGPRP